MNLKLIHSAVILQLSSFVFGQKDSVIDNRWIIQEPENVVLSIREKLKKDIIIIDSLKVNEDYSIIIHPTGCYFGVTPSTDTIIISRDTLGFEATLIGGQERTIGLEHLMSFENYSKAVERGVIEVNSSKENISRDISKLFQTQTLKKIKKLTEDDIKAIRQFEYDLNRLKMAYIFSTSTDFYYINSKYGNREVRDNADKQWNGGNKLIKQLFGVEK